MQQEQDLDVSLRVADDELLLCVVQAKRGDFVGDDVAVDPRQGPVLQATRGVSREFEESLKRV